MKKARFLTLTLTLLFLLSIALSSCGLLDFFTSRYQPPISLDEVPEFSGRPYVVINGNVPFFTDEEKVTDSYETYYDLDGLGRCTLTVACIGIDIMPTEDRESLDTKPTGWQSVKYDIVDGKFLYNRCHLIGFQLTGENDNEKNLITGTRYLNVEGMFPFEDMVADYVKETGNHVMYRVTPIFEGNELVARGVLMEAWSVEDNGDGICFNIYAYNNQPGIVINYMNGDSALDDGSTQFPDDAGDSGSGDSDSGKGEENEGELDPAPGTETFVINTSTKKYHKPTCTYASSNNTESYTGKRADLEEDGYEACKVCKP